MAEGTINLPKRGSAPGALAPIGRAWGRISPSLVPVLAVLTALIITIPFMIVTGGRGDFARGLNIAGTAYGALIEGALGLAVNDQVSLDDLDLIIALANSAAAEGAPLTQNGLRELDRAVGDLALIGAENARRYAAALTLAETAFPDYDDDALVALGENVPDLRAYAAALADETNRAIITELEAADRAEVRELAQSIATEDTLSAENRAALEGFAPSAAGVDDAQMLTLMDAINEEGIVRMSRLVPQLDALSAAGVPLDAPELTALSEIPTLTNDIGAARRVASVVEVLETAGTNDAAALEGQIATVRELYNLGLLTESDVQRAITTELESAIHENLIVRRPGNRLVVDPGNSLVGSVMNPGLTPEDTSDDKIDVTYLRFGDASALLFFPGNLEVMIVRSIPFIIAGLAVALGFKAGLFNIGAEGQLYAGAIIAAWFGFSPIFASLPSFIHIPLVLIIGLLGGALFGAIPGALKAYTGAHEVIVTIMLNYIAVLIVDWLIKSTNPWILGDPNASNPSTPNMLPSAQLPRFDTISPWLFIIAGVIWLAIGLYTRRDEIKQNWRAALRPVINALLIAVGGLFLIWITVRGALHIGFLVMLFAVWFSDWFLNKTTLGFELRTVGENPDAARYAGMSVPRNIILAMALSGALAGLAGTIEMTGVQMNMKPEFFAGLGFDAIAVALLARTNMRNMLAAGFLWGALLAGAGLMQLRADISIDLVKIIQALIIMFIAADAIIRYLWAIPKPTEKTPTLITGWGGK